MAYDYVLAPDEQKELLRIARTTIKEYLISGRIPPGAPHRASLVAPAAVFVSLNVGAELRGCIGTTQEGQPLYRAIQEMSIAAAKRDPRFPPLTPQELGSVCLEVSVLGSFVGISGPDEIVIGTHGVTVASPEGQRGLLLPKVAVEQGWNGATLLTEACAKASLPSDYWRRAEAQLFRFTAQVFDEQTLATGPFAPVRV